MKKFNFNIVYITDKPLIKNNINLSSSIEENSEYASKRIFDALSSICTKAYYYDNINNFCENISEHKNDIVFTTMYGKSAANSKALVPAICEANNIIYVGADSYSQMICNDKYLSKRYTQGYGINGASDVIIRRPDSLHEFSLLSTLKYPVIIKPNYGGGSTGISQDNVKKTLSEAKDFVIQLYKHQNQPILVEEYIEGYEVELILLGNSSDIKLCHEVKLLMDGEEYYNNTIWGYETKKIDDNDIYFSSSNHISTEDLHKLINLFKSFSKIEFMRIDCRINDSGLKLIELSPDCYLGEDCAFFFAFQEKGYSFEEMLIQIIKNSIENKIKNV